MGGDAVETAVRDAVAATGNVTVQGRPTQLRMYIQLAGKGKTIEEALAKLKQTREKALAQLEKLNADKKSISVTTPTAGGSSDDDRRRQLEQMIRQRMRGGRGAKAIKLPEVVSVKCMLTAGWTLPGADREQLLLTAHKLQKDLKAADLGGSKDQGLTPEEQELAEEMENSPEFTMPSSYGGQEEAQPGVPYFVYVATISDQEHQKALGEAFEKAKQQAGQLAQAAGAKLGRLVSVGGGMTSAGESFGGGGFMPSRVRAMLAAQLGRRSHDQKENEAVSSDPNEVAFQVYVQAAFALETPSGTAPRK